MRVLARRRALERDLARARRRRSPDVGLYEASLRTANKPALRNGLILIVVISSAGLFTLVAIIQMLAGVFYGPP